MHRITSKLNIKNIPKTEINLTYKYALALCCWIWSKVENIENDSLVPGILWYFSFVNKTKNPEESREPD